MKKNFLHGGWLFLVSANLLGKTPLCISLGSACGPALNLRSLNLRTEAYPFDWTVSSFEALYAALETDFSFFLSDVHEHAEKTSVIDYYGFQFSHDWPTGNRPKIDALNADSVNNCLITDQWKDVLPDVREKYRRRIERFRKVCEGKEKVFFIRSEQITKEQALKLRDFFTTKYPALDFVLIVVSYKNVIERPWSIPKIKNFSIKNYSDNQHWAEMLKKVGPEFRFLTIKKG